eukprot:SAG31_NODE_16266_length_716_cov_0.833063_1_plen_22_part_01
MNILLHLWAEDAVGSQAPLGGF